MERLVMEVTSQILTSGKALKEENCMLPEINPFQAQRRGCHMIVADEVALLRIFVKIVPRLQMSGDETKTVFIVGYLGFVGYWKTHFEFSVSGLIYLRLLKSKPKKIFTIILCILHKY
jgi:hypothetical protein